MVPVARLQPFEMQVFPRGGDDRLFVAASEWQQRVRPAPAREPDTDQSSQHST